jgi:hypothetical protein
MSFVLQPWHLLLTILRRHRQLVAEKWDYGDRRKAVGRPRVRPEIVDLVLRRAKENPSWGDVRLQGALANCVSPISARLTFGTQRDRPPPGPTCARSLLPPPA